MNIRNFCIIAHIDHGKSTLADRMLELTGTVRKLEHSQMLDRLDIEQERGITIKLTPARMKWKDYELNLIDTPGHVDFQYEVSRSLAAVEGAILLVDASQGIQAQTLAVLYMALDFGIEIIPVLNKIDLPAANPERVAQEIEKMVGISAKDIIKISGKTGLNVEQVLDAVIERIPDPDTFKKSNAQKMFLGADLGYDKELGDGARALIFDSVYDPYKGVLCYVKIIDGSIKAGQKLNLIYSETAIEPPEIGYFTPNYQKDKELTAGQIGYIVTGQKSVRDAQIGDTVVKFSSQGNGILAASQGKDITIPGFKKVKPYVYAGVYPTDSNEFDKLRDSFAKLALNDSALDYEYENSVALGYGFRCGFLGMLHMEIVKERLVREYGLETMFTIPTVVYLVKTKNLFSDAMKTGANILHLVKSGLYIHIISDFTGRVSPEEAERILYMTDAEISERYKEKLKFWMIATSGADVTDWGVIDEIYEPFSDVEIVGPKDFSGNIMELCQEYRGNLKHMEYIDDLRVLRRYDMPLGEMIIDFYDKLKSATKGYATMNYEFTGYRNSDLVKVDIYINAEKVEAFSMVVHREKAYNFGSDIVKKLKELIPRHMFPIPIQAGIGGRMIARETISAMSKDVLAKCYGGDVSRKRKLLEKQKEGKKKMKSMGSVNIPNDIFMKMLNRN